MANWQASLPIANLHTKQKDSIRHTDPAPKHVHPVRRCFVGDFSRLALTLKVKDGILCEGLLATYEVCCHWRWGLGKVGVLIAEMMCLYPQHHRLVRGMADRLKKAVVSHIVPFLYSELTIV